MTAADPDTNPKPPRGSRVVPLALIAGTAAAVFYLAAEGFLSFDVLRENRAVLTSFVMQNMALAACLFMIVYAAATALSLPGGAVLSIAAGFLFGTFYGTLWAVIGSTAGAVGIFLAARSTLAEGLHERTGPWLKKLERGFNENALSYLLVLRLVPLFPFFVVNLVPAFLGMRFRVYVLGTILGIIPGTFVFVSVGTGLGSVFDRGDHFSPASAFTPEVVVALVGLCVLSLLPVVYKKLKARTAEG